MRLLLIVIALAAAACSKQPEQATANGVETDAEGAPVAGINRTHKGEAAPKAAFNAPDGAETNLDDFRGKPVLVNLWASWCAPCVKELPTLDRLADAQDGRLTVLAISQDTGPHPSVRAFLKSKGIKTLGAYHDPTMSMSGILEAQVLPSSVLFDAQGREVWRYVGDLDWTGAEAAKLLAEGGVPAG
jgi:thiol-disulfide isomerase/thioredoxin